MWLLFLEIFMNRHQITLLHRSQLVIKSPIVWEIENQTKMLQNKTSGMFWLFKCHETDMSAWLIRNCFWQIKFLGFFYRYCPRSWTMWVVAKYFINFILNWSDLNLGGGIQNIIYNPMAIEICGWYIHCAMLQTYFSYFFLSLSRLISGFPFMWNMIKND